MKNFLKLAGIVVVVFVSFHWVYADTTSGLVAHWKFDENSGTTATDSSGNGNTGTLGGKTSFVPGRFGNAVRVPSDVPYSNTYVRINTNKMPANNAPQSISLWFNRDGTGSDDFISLDNSSNSAIGLSNTYLSAFKWGGWEIVSSFFVPSANIWHHLVYTYDGTTHTLYYDGSFFKSSNVAPNTAIPTIVRIGRGARNCCSWGNVTIDDVRIYNRALSATEIQQLYNPLSQGNIVISATLDGQPWPTSGSSAITYSLSGPSGNISNSSVPFTYANVPANVNYTLNYVGGGPAGATIDPISPASSQLLPQNSTIIFTMNFKSAPLPISASCSAFPTSINVGESSRWTASASGGTGGPYTYTWSGTDNLSGITNSPVNYINHTYLSVNTSPGHSVSVTVRRSTKSKSVACANAAQVAPVVGADLTGRALGINGNRVPEQAITFSGDVFNLPGKNTSGPSTARICINNANCLTSSAGSLGEFPISALSANMNSIPLNTSNPWIMTLGTHTYYVCADVYGTNTETSEANNCGSQTFTATECSNGVDDIDSEDNLSDTADPGCHADADASNPASYNALDDNEANPACSDPFDNDGDGANNCADPGCHTDHNYKNSVSCDPTINNEFYVTQCEDADALGVPIDNDGDGKANSLDPGCHWDGNVNNPNSYDKYDNSEGDLSFREVFEAFMRPFASLLGF